MPTANRLPPRPPLRVVELAQGIAGPTCGRLFAALGDLVVKCEPALGDELRRRPPLDELGEGYAFQALNASKRSVVADWHDPTGRQAIEALMAGADVVIVDQLPSSSVADSQVTKIRERWPHLVVVSITPFGLDPNFADWPGDSLLAEAYGGLASMVGDADARPLSLGGEQAAHAAGFAGFLGASLALGRRGSDGRGELVDVACCDVAAYMDWKSDISLAAGQADPIRRGSAGGTWRMVRAIDGVVGVIFQPDQWQALVDLVGDDRLRAPELRDEATRVASAASWWPIVEAWVAPLPKREVFERAQRVGLAFGYDADVGDVVNSKQYAARGFIRSSRRGGAPVVGALVSSEQLSWETSRAPAIGEHQGFAWPDESVSSGPCATPRAGGSRGARPLEGVRVVDFGTITAGAATSRLLADYGATVVKIESEEHPDLFRRWTVTGGLPAGGPDAAFISPMFESNNVNKLGVRLDLRDPTELDRVFELVASADVVVENFRVGVTERLGIDFKSLEAVNPDLVYLSLSSQGLTGPEARYRSYGSTLDLLSGLAALTGYDAEHPMWSSAEVNYPDQLVPFVGAGLVAYCLERGRRGVHLDVAQREVVTWTLADVLAEFCATGTKATGQGNRRPGAAPHEIFPVTGKNRWVAISCRRDEERAALAALVGLQEVVEDQEAFWVAHEDELEERIRAWTAGQDRSACVAALRTSGVPAAPVLSALERATEPHFLKRQVFLPGPPRLKGYPFVFESLQPDPPSPAPGLGADNDRVFEALGRPVVTKKTVSPCHP